MKNAAHGVRSYFCFTACALINWATLKTKIPHIVGHLQRLAVREGNEPMPFVR